MIAPGKIGVLRFPRTDLGAGKQRPVLVLARLPGRHDDWLVCMFSTQIHQAVEDFDEVIKEEDRDFKASGLTLPSVIRVGRLAVVSSEVLTGATGEIATARLERIRG